MKVRFLIFAQCFGILACLGGMAGTVANAQEQTNAPEPPNFERWRCRQCEFDYGLHGGVLFGGGYVSDDFFEFGNYRGLEKQGGFGLLDADWLYRDEKGRFLDLIAEDLGLDNRDLRLEGGVQGRYTAWLGFDEIPYFRAEDTRSIFDNAGTSLQTLRPGWVRDGRADFFPALEENLKPIDLKHEREMIRLGFEIGGQSPWTAGVDVRRTTKQGNRIQGGSFIFNAIELASPVNYETTQLDANLGYGGAAWEVEAAYSYSSFDNRNFSVVFENPFFGINGSDIGELAQAPDNDYHQIMLSGSWRVSPLLMLAGQVAFGRIEQDQRFVSPSLNPRFGDVAPALGNLDGEVDTRTVRFRATSRVTRKLRATFELEYDERDNDSARASFEQVVADTFLVSGRVNEPFSYERTAAEARLDYRLFRFIRLDASARLEDTSRDFQEVNDTESEIYRGRVRLSPLPNLNLTAEYRFEDRTNDLDPSLLPALENPNLRRFHFAEKERDAFRFTADYAITENLVAGLYGELADEDFTDTKIGLSTGRTESYGIDLSITLPNNINAHAFYAYELLDATILGADNITGVPWEARQEDRYNTIGAGIVVNELPGKWFNASLDFSYADSEGDIRVIKRNISPVFPELQTDRFELEAGIERALAERWNLRFEYLVGRLTENDFFRDLVEPGTLPNLLSLGEGTPGRTVHVVSAGLRYRFN